MRKIGSKQQGWENEHQLGGDCSDTSTGMTAVWTGMEAEALVRSYTEVSLVVSGQDSASTQGVQTSGLVCVLP